MKRNITILLLATLLFPAAATGQPQGFSLFKPSEVMRPFMSEIRSTIVKVEVADINKLDRNYYVSDYAERPFVEIHLGVDIPLVNYYSPEIGIKLNFTWEIGNILLIDMFEELTSPVINTDYFFGWRAGAIKYTGTGAIKNVGLEFVPLFHESTHIGDEFAIHGFSEIPDFMRVNISYEAWEIAAVINDPDTIRSNLLSFKSGLQGLWSPSDGYYGTDTLETKGYIVPPGSRNLEYYLQLNLQRTEGFLCSERWMNVLSAEARNRIQFSYETGIPEERGWNYNIYFGWKRIVEGSRRNIGFFLRHYRGIIPHGQFRNTDGFRYTGVSIIYG